MFLRFDPNKFRVYLKLSMERLKQFQLKQESLNANARREIASLLEKKKDELARIKTEQLIRDDYLIDAAGILEVYCNLLHARSGLLESSKSCDPSLKEAVCSIIWATPRMQMVPEFKQIAKGLEVHFGREFYQAAAANSENAVNLKLLSKLSISRLNPAQVEEYLSVIAEKYKIPYTRQSQPMPLDEFDPSSAFASRLPPGLLPPPVPVAYPSSSQGQPPYIGEAEPSFANPFYSTPGNGGGGMPSNGPMPPGGGGAPAYHVGFDPLQPGMMMQPYGAYPNNAGYPPPMQTSPAYPYPPQEVKAPYPSPPPPQPPQHQQQQQPDQGVFPSSAFAPAQQQQQPQQQQPPPQQPPQQQPSPFSNGIPQFPSSPSHSHAHSHHSSLTSQYPGYDEHNNNDQHHNDDTTPPLELPSVPGSGSGGGSGGGGNGGNGNGGSSGGGGGSGGGSSLQWDDLERRFEMLRSKK